MATRMPTQMPCQIPPSKQDAQGVGSLARCSFLPVSCAQRRSEPATPVVVAGRQMTVREKLSSEDWVHVGGAGLGGRLGVEIDRGTVERMQYPLSPGR